MQAQPIRVRVEAADTLALEGAYLLVKAAAGLLVVPSWQAADVLVAALDEIPPELPAPEPPMVIIAARITEEDLERLADHAGVVVLPRHTVTVAMLLSAVRAAAAGEPGLLDEARAYLAARPVPPVADPVFTERELAMLGLLADGVGTEEIARKLFLSARTVKVTVAAMKSRLGLRNRTHAVAAAIRAGRI
jgi:DNA-binding NarL/FixJ family response regulator